MRQASGPLVMGMLGVAVLLAQGCVTLSGSGGSEEHMAQEEMIDEPVIQHILPQDPTRTTSLTRASKRVELTARNATGLLQGSLTDVLFDFDRASIRTDALPTLEANARRLMADGVTRLLLEGRGDEIGTAAYNLVLGDRRAKNVKAYLLELGIVVDLRTTSYGKDRPLCFQHSRDCWQKNRSVHFVVKE
jgi:peptidoglycan-associated lipoprotein